MEDEILEGEIIDSEKNEVEQPAKRKRGRPRKHVEIVLDGGKDTFLGYKIEKGNYIYSDEQIAEALLDCKGFINKTAEYLQINPRTLVDRMAQNPQLRSVQDLGERMATAEIEQLAFQKALGGNEKSIIFWLSRRGGEKWIEKKEVSSTNKNMNMNLNVDMSKLTTEELNDIRSKLSNTIITE